MSDDLNVTYSQATKILDEVIRKRFIQNKIVYTVSTDSGVSGVSKVSCAKTPQQIEKLQSLLSPVSFLFDPSFLNSYFNQPEFPFTLVRNQFLITVTQVEKHNYLVTISSSSDSVKFIEFLDTYDPLTSTLKRGYLDLLLVFKHGSLIQYD